MPQPTEADGKTKQDEAPQEIREAGPRRMSREMKRKWDRVDEESDESFPASDPPGNY